MLVLVACRQTIAAPTPTAVAPTPTVPATRAPQPTRATAPTSTPRPRTLETFYTQLQFETYETEETVQLELGQLPGVASVNVTQLDVTVQYDPARVSKDEILRTLRDNPEVRIKDDTRAGQ